MYIPKPFEITDDSEKFVFIQANAFGQLISQLNGKLFSTYMPFLLSEDKTKIYGHLAIANPQHTQLAGQEVLITLEGAHGYVSPSWYNSPGVPTWNYQAVHIYGICSLINDVEKLKLIVDALTNKYESAFEQPWQTEYKAAMLNAIVGVEISISEIQCKYKLSQNRPKEDQQKVATQLKSNGHVALAAAMDAIQNN